jgi:hypothetical protein
MKLPVNELEALFKEASQILCVILLMAVLGTEIQACVLIWYMCAFYRCSLFASGFAPYFQNPIWVPGISFIGGKAAGA